MSDFLERFRTPGPDYRGKPFWAWNGKLDKAELLRQVDILKEMGFGGFFMHSRTGLATEYMGEEWFSLINACADRAGELNMQAWLYDEDRWPSGTCGGAISKDHAMRMHALRMTRNATVADERDFASALAVFSVTEEDGVVREYARLHSFADAQAPAGELVRFDVHEMQESSFYNGETYIDTMAAEPTRRFLESTHARYVAECGDRVGKTIQGIFTDEPHRGGMMSLFGGVGDNCDVPFTERLPERFSEAFGYDVTDRLPELFLCMGADVVAPIKWQYVELCERLFLENFAAPIDAFCRKNGLILTGHVLHEDNLTSQTAMSGSMMRYYEYMEYPGIDFLGQYGRCYWSAKQLQSVAHQLGKKQTLSELYGCTGWQMRLENYKAIGDWQALYGIDLRCPHISWYTMEGQAKRDYPASILHQSTWYPEWNYLETYYARIAEFEHAASRRCEVLVLNPVESVWARVRAGWCNGLDPKGEDICRLEQQYENTFRWLQQGHIDFDYGDEGLLEKYGENDDGTFRVGFGAYSAVVVSGMDTIRSSTLDLLRAFVEDGGHVVLVGEPPKYRDCLPFRWDIPCVRVKNDAESLRSTLAPYAVRLEREDGSPEEKLLCQRFDRDGAEYLIVMNQDREQPASATLYTRRPGTVTRLYPEDGRLENLGEFPAGVTLPVELPACGLMLLVVGRPLSDRKPAAPPVLTRAYTVPGPVRYELDEPNLCVLDTAAVSVNGGAFSDPVEVLRADRLLRDAFGLPRRGGDMLQPWFVRQKRIEAKGRAALRFGFRVDSVPADGVTLVLENPERWTLSVNGHPLTYAPNSFYWADACMKAVRIPAGFLLTGENAVLCETDFDETSGCEAMYLQGDFGVRLDGAERTLTLRPETLAFGDIVPQGFPFYSGKVTYLCPVPQTDGPSALRFDRPDCACVRTEGGGRSVMTAWQPYEADTTGMAKEGLLRVTAVGTRRNTFGPLHIVPAVTPYTGPEHFETTGDEYTDAYSLIPFGLAAPTFLY